MSERDNNFIPVARAYDDVTEETMPLYVEESTDSLKIDVYYGNSGSYSDLERSLRDDNNIPVAAAYNEDTSEYESCRADEYLRVDLTTLENEYAVQTNGTNEYFRTGSKAGGYRSSIMTVGGWFSTTQSGTRTLMSKFQSFPTRLSWHALLINGILEVKFAQNQAGSVNKTYRSVSTYNSGQYVQWFSTINCSTNVMKLYVNGVELTGASLNKVSDTNLSGISNTTTFFSICARNNFSSNFQAFLGGLSDENMIWLGDELSSAQIVELYGSGVPVDPRKTTAGTPSHWYRMGDIAVVNGNTTLVDQGTVGVNLVGVGINVATDFVTDVPN